MQPSMIDGQLAFRCVFRAEPVQWQAPKSARTRSGITVHYTSQEYKDYKETLGMALRAAWRAPADAVNEFWVDYQFHCGSEGRKNPRDGDNMAKTVGDAGNKIIWKDDSQITLWRRIEVFRGSMNPCTVIEGGLR